MEDIKIELSLSYVVGLCNEITMLRELVEQNVLVEEPDTTIDDAEPNELGRVVQKEVKLLGKNGKPLSRKTHPLFKPGRKSILEELPDSFTYTVAMNHGISDDNLRKWKYRGYITSDDEFSLFHKTELYKERIKQAKLIRKED